MAIQSPREVIGDTENRIGDVSVEEDGVSLQTHWKTCCSKSRVDRDLLYKDNTFPFG